MRRALQILAVLLLGGLLAVMALDLRHDPASSKPRLVEQLRGTGRLRAGAARVTIQVPFPVVAAGYGPRDRHLVARAAEPQYARAVALQVDQAKLTVVSVDLLEIDSAFMDDLRPRLPRDAGAVWVCATHTHTGMGDYDPNPLAQIAGTGRFYPEVRQALLSAVTSSVGDAWKQPHLVDVHAEQADLELTEDRSHSDDPPDPRATVIQFLDGNQTIARIWNYAAHPTLVSRKPQALDADFPGALTFAQPLELFVNGAVGNAALNERDVAQVAHDIRFGMEPGRDLQQWGGQLGLSVETARVDLPGAEIHDGPGFTRRASSSLVDRLAAPRTADLSVARLGPLTLIAVPGEPTAAAGRALQQAVGDPNALIFGLCNGYVGYIETPDRVQKGIGEAPRQYFDATLLDRFVSAAKVAAHALGPPTGPGAR